MSIDNGGSAFPGKRINYINGLQQEESFDGMTLRDYFAAKAMQGMESDQEIRISINRCAMKLGHSPAKEIAIQAYDIADRMLEVRNQGERV